MAGVLHDGHGVLGVGVAVGIEAEYAVETARIGASTVGTTFLTDLMVEVFVCEKLGEDLEWCASGGGVGYCWEGEGAVVYLIGEGKEGFGVAGEIWSRDIC